MAGALPSSERAPRVRRLVGCAVALAVTGGITLAMVAVRERLDPAHVALLYLLGVLGASAWAGRAVGLATALASFLAFNFWFVPPYHTLVVAHPRDWLVLAVFLATSAVAAQLLARAQEEAAAARQRSAEIDRLAALGAETLSVGRAEEGLAAVVGVIRATLDLDRCDVYLQPQAGDAMARAAGSGRPGAPDGEREDVAPLDDTNPLGDAAASDYGRHRGVPGGRRLAEWVAATGRLAVHTADGVLRVGPGPLRAGDPALDAAGARDMLLPLVVHGRTVGVLRVAREAGLALDAARLRFLEALSYYAALGAERVRLVAAAEHAEALRQADALKNAVIASVSHDLRTPLTTIKALAHGLAADGDERALVIEEEADRLNRFVADLLDMSQLAGGALAVRPEVNAVEDLVGAALQRVGGAQAGRAIDVTLDASEPLLLGRFDFVHALRALVNLLENALKYSPAGAPVELSARRRGDTVDLVVADRGPGVPAAERERIFEPFYRPPAAPPDVGGRGLGLSIARRLAEAQGGSVRHEPREEGGSRFVLSLPAADLSEIPSEPAPPPRP